MSTWPADYRKRLQTAESSSKSKGKAKAKNTSSEYDSQRTDVPLLRLGSRGAAALVNKNGRLEWVFAADNSFRANHRKILSRGRTLQLIPDSSTGPPVEPSITPLQRAEQETQFLRTYHPDIDVGFDILREHIIEDHEKYKDGHSFDPFQGNQMAVIELPESTEEHSALRRFLIYACGETGSQINICPFITSSSGLEILSPRIEIAHDFRTPVQQVTASGGFVAIRTNTIVFLMNAIAEKNVGSQGRTVRLELLDKWNLGDSQGNRLMDIAIRKLPDKELVQLALVDAAGGVWIWGSSDNGSFTKKLILSSTRVESKANEAATWRVCWGSNFKTILRMSHTAISVVNVTVCNHSSFASLLTPHPIGIR
ncbi:hypothetical protein FRC03_012252 [Tulasnella sp. 419]|nr:hypothetical protein FRC03_012252 [Tulasnella sp. 419]